MGFHISDGQLLWFVAALSQVDVFDQSYFPADRFLQRILSEGTHDNGNKAAWCVGSYSTKDILQLCFDDSGMSPSIVKERV